MRVPQNLSEVTIDKYIKAIDIIENEDVELVVMLRLLNLFSGKRLEQLAEYPLAELDKNYTIVQYQNLKSQCHFHLANKINANEIYIQATESQKEFITQELEQVS